MLLGKIFKRHSYEELVLRDEEGYLYTEVDEKLLKDPAAMQCSRCGFLATDRGDGRCPYCGARYKGPAMLADPIEKSRAYKKAMKELEPHLKHEFNQTGMYPGLCWRYWERKKTLLLQKYHIRWRTPGEMNPGMWFE